jgi:sterol desaturase/sphingolipid hydroxylase (fatty acid hydroxylase superfamily)
MPYDTLAAFAGQWLENLSVDLTRYAIFAVATWFVLWVLLAGWLQHLKIRPDRPPSRQLLTELVVSLRSLAVFSTVGLFLFGLERAGHFDGPAIAAGWGPAWAVVSLALMIVAQDTYFYWTHRAMHHRRLFRVFHRRHHRSHNPSPFTAYSFDIAEAAVQAAFVPLWMLLVPTTWPIAGLFMLHQLFRNTLGHSGYELYPASRDGKPLVGWMTTVTHHDLHHAQAGWNYGLWFTWWDRLMGTEHPEYLARFSAARQARRKPSPEAA